MGRSTRPCYSSWTRRRTSPRSRTVYGRRAATIVNNHRAKLFGTGISDPETAGYISRVVGAAEFAQHSHSKGDRGSRSLTEGQTYRDLAPANVVRERDPGTALLMYHHLPLAQISLRPRFHHRAPSPK